MRFKFHIFDVYFAVILLSAIVSGAFSCALFKSNLQTSAEMVYCPLTKKLQPVNPPKNIAPTYLLNEICAADSEKNKLEAAISEYSKLKLTVFNLNNFEDTAFDFWQKGKTAFDILPNMPGAPEKSAAKNSFSPVGFGGDFDVKLFWKTSESFAFQIQPRPPTTLDTALFNLQFFLKFDRISRRIAPRAPPVFV